MKRKLTLLWVLAVIAMLMTASLPAQAGDRQDAEGLWEYRNLTQVPHPIGCALLLEITEESRWTGTFHGSGGPDDYAYSTEKGFVYFDCQGGMLFAGIVDFPTVTVGDDTGGLKMSVVGRRPAGEEWSGRWSVIRATGELAGMRGHGTWWGPGWNPDFPEDWGPIPYAGTLRFR